MDYFKAADAKEYDVEAVSEARRELSDIELALVGGGIGDTIL